MASQYSIYCSDTTFKCVQFPYLETNPQERLEKEVQMFFQKHFGNYLAGYFLSPRDDIHLFVTIISNHWHLFSN